MLAQEDLYDRIGKGGHTVLATADQNSNAEAAYIAFAVVGGKIIFCTEEGSRKFANIKMNPNVALVFGFDGVWSIQAEGVARILDAEDAGHGAARDALATAVPQTEHFINAPGYALFAIELDWAKLTDFGQKPPHIEEYSFAD